MCNKGRLCPTCEDAPSGGPSWENLAVDPALDPDPVTPARAIRRKKEEK